MAALPGPAKKETASRGPWDVCKVILLFILSQWLLIGMGVACVLAYYFPGKDSLPFHGPRQTKPIRLLDVAAPGGTIRAEYSIVYGDVAIIFLISGLQLSPAKLRENVTNWRLHAIVQGMSFIISPLIVLGMCNGWNHLYCSLTCDTYSDNSHMLSRRISSVWNTITSNSNWPARNSMPSNDNCFQMS